MVLVATASIVHGVIRECFVRRDIFVERTGAAV